MTSAKVAFTVLWAGVLMAVDSFLEGFTWAQYLAIFVLAGLYAFTVDKLPVSRGKSAREGP